MTEPVKRYYIMESAVVPMLDKQMTYTPLVNYKTDVHVIPLVMDADYARLEQECERLRLDAERYRLYRQGMENPEAFDAGVDAALSAKP
ncbi:hypothetical protein [uncultured Pseudomonas sp.]|uniref:hypothetical protein n=1 Tax=uncultured Pseudomonas sp. TaxID=114707 RepID=UPI0030DB511E|tara:strand:- start:252 stop:518 length:267 start_codon:yes stop_codon:yes gene_type:complete